MSSLSGFPGLSQNTGSDQDEGISDLDKILRNLELENKQEVRLLEKEKQQIQALERSITEKQEGIQKIEDDLSKFDEDAKTLHRQFRQNRNNAESLRKHADVLSCHGDALETKHLQMQEKYAVSREERLLKLDHYRSVWNNYLETYESSPQAKVWRACHEDVEMGVKHLMEQAETVQRLTEAIQEIENKLSRDAVKEDWRKWIIEIAKTKLTSSSMLKEIDEVKKRIEALRGAIEGANQEKMKKAAIERAASQLQNREEVNQPSENNNLTPISSMRETSPLALSQPVLNSPVPNSEATVPNSQAPVPNSSHTRVPRLFFPSPAPSIPKSTVHGAAVRHLPPQPSPSRYIQIPQLPQRSKVIEVGPSLPPIPAGRVRTDVPLTGYYPIPQTSLGSTVDVASVPTVPHSQSHTDSNLQDDAPMETDSQAGLEPGFPTTSPKTPTAAEEEELSVSQVREKLLSLEKSPGFSYRPMFDHDMEMPVSPSQAARTQDTSNPFFSASSMFGQMTSRPPASNSAISMFGNEGVPTKMTSSSPASNSAISMFGSQGGEEPSDGNIMSLFASGPPSQEDQPSSQETSSFSFNFSSSPSTTEPSSTFSLF